MANAEIVAIGSELLLGQIVDTNSTWLAQRLTALGINLFYKTVVGDNPGRMKEVLTQALERSDVVITSGGLGPTQDDLTREVVAEVTGRKLVLDPHLLGQIEHRFRSRPAQADQRFRSPPGAGATGSSRCAEAACAGTAPPCVSWRGTAAGCRSGRSPGEAGWPGTRQRKRGRP